MSTKWGLLATGNIAHKLAKAITNSNTGELVAVGSRSADSARTFADKWHIESVHDSYDALLANPAIDAVYVSTPHPLHAEWTIKALDSGKDVLCEKPMGLNHAEVMAMVHAAQLNHRVLLEAFMYRLHPQTKKLMELVSDGTIGDIRHVTAAFGFNAPFNASSRLWANELGGGGIMDVGCYPVSMTRLVAGSEPKQVSAHALLSPTKIDIYSAALFEFENGIGAHVATGVGQQLDNTVTIYGSRGSIYLPQPWLGLDRWRISVRVGGETEVFEGEAENLYGYEVDEVDRLRSEGELESPAMNWQDSLGNALALDRWRAAAGVEFERELPNTLMAPVKGRPLRITPDAMAYGNVSGIERPISRLVMGCDNQPNLTHATVMFDEYVERGGNVFDTAHIYGGGRIEALLGHWLSNRNVRNSVNLIGKGAHTPFNQPEQILPQLQLSLDRLQTDHLDIYFLHRDNLEIPVGEWIDALNEVKDMQLVRFFGGSNWTIERVREATEYANANNKQAFTAVSNQFSLAEMINPVWAGCVSANTKAFIEYLTTEQMALFPWSSQARGFFTPRFDDVVSESDSNVDTRHWGHPDDAEMRRCWFSNENFERRKRATELSKSKNVDLINIALSYVLNQSFPTFPLIGPRFLWELSSSTKALEVELSADEIAWLNLEKTSTT